MYWMPFHRENAWHSEKREGEAVFFLFGEAVLK